MNVATLIGFCIVHKASHYIFNSCDGDCSLARPKEFVSLSPTEKESGTYSGSMSLREKLEDWRDGSATKVRELKFGSSDTSKGQVGMAAPLQFQFPEQAG